MTVEEAEREKAIRDQIVTRVAEALDRHLVLCIREYPETAKDYYSAKRDWQVDVTPDTPLFSDFTVIMKDPSKQKAMKLAVMKAAIEARGFVCAPYDGCNMWEVGWRVQVPPE